MWLVINFNFFCMNYNLSHKILLLPIDLNESIILYYDVTIIDKTMSLNIFVFRGPLIWLM